VGFAPILHVIKDVEKSPTRQTCTQILLTLHSTIPSYHSNSTTILPQFFKTKIVWIALFP